MAGKTLYDKLWAMHEVTRRDDGSSLVYIDRHILHEVTSPQAFEGLRLAGRKPRDRAYYLQHGRPVDAVVTKVDKRGQRTAWRIKARYRDPRSGEGARFKSELLRANPGHRIRVGDSIRVYRDPERPNRYWMDSGTDAEYL